MLFQRQPSTSILSDPLTEMSFSSLPVADQRSRPLGLERPIEQKYCYPLLWPFVDHGIIQGPNRGSIMIQTSSPIDMAKRNFISLEPKIPFTVNPEYNGFTIDGPFQPRQRYVLTLKKELSTRTGSQLGEEFKKAFVFSDVEPSIAFPTGGMFLAPAEDSRIPLETVNIDEVEMSLWRLYENNIPYAVMTGINSVPRELSNLTAQKKAKIQGTPNIAERRAIDLRELAKDEKGVFLLTARNTAPNPWQEAQQVVASPI